MDKGAHGTNKEPSSGRKGDRDSGGRSPRAQKQSTWFVVRLYFKKRKKATVANTVAFISVIFKTMFEM